MVPVSVSLVSRRACRFGASGFCVRHSAHSFSGFVAVAGFRSFRQAGLFARWAAPAVKRSVFVRSRSGFHWVSVPVLPASVPKLVRAGAPVVRLGSPPACRLAFLSGGEWAL